MTIDALLTIFGQYGLPSILLFVVGVAYYKKDQAFVAEQKARIEDAKIFYERLAKGQEAIMSIAERFADETEVRTLTRELLTVLQQQRTLTDEIKQRDRDREITGARKPGGLR